MLVLVMLPDSSINMDKSNFSIYNLLVIYGIICYMNNKYIILQKWRNFYTNIIFNILNVVFQHNFSNIA